MRRSSGQASLEYVGLLLVVAAVLGLTGAATAGADIADAVPRALRAALCRVTGAVCTSAEARDAGLEPCVVGVSSRGERLRATIAVVRLERGDAMVIERRSDGTASVSVLDELGLGGETGVGVSFAPLRLRGEATLGAGVSFQGGRVWDFPTVAAAQRFARRIADDESLLGEVRGALPGGADRRRLRPPDAVARRGGAGVDGELQGQLPLLGRRGALDVEASVAAVLGRTTRGARTTWHLALTSEALASLGVLFAALGVEATRDGVLEYTTVDGRPETARVRAATGLAGDLRVFGQRTDLGRLAGVLRGASARGNAAGRGGLSAEVALTLDLTNESNLAAVEAVLRPGPQGRVEALRRLGARLDAHGKLDVAVLRTTTRRERSGGAVRLGVALAGELTRTTQDKELVQAWSARGGGPLRDRDDCGAK